MTIPKNRRQNPARFCLCLTSLVASLPAPIGASAAPATFSRILLVLALALFAYTPLAAGTAPASSDTPTAKGIRFGFSINLFSGINEIDARAALRTLTGTISRNKSIPANPEPIVTQTIPQAEELLKAGTIDVFGMTVEEYRLLKGKVAFDRHLFTAVDEKSEEVYLLIVNKLGTIRSLRDLKGRHLLVHDDPRTHLAWPWLDLELQKQGQPGMDNFFGSIEENPKPSKVVLPVFFRKTDACLITERSFREVADLNPQVTSELQVLAQSQPYVPLVIALSTSIPPSLEERICQEFANLHTTTYGQQGLVVFQTRRIVERPVSVLDRSLEMLAQHERLCPVASAERRGRFYGTRDISKP